MRKPSGGGVGERVIPVEKEQVQRPSAETSLASLQNCRSSTTSQRGVEEDEVREEMGGADPC